MTDPIEEVVQITETTRNHKKETDIFQIKQTPVSPVMSNNIFIQPNEILT
ncbi:hypothetical protein DJ93_5816 [Bacillus clarus]|uniref:Uncharacterized protein n=1 Tax=Bacillus clarus TaxID=2338372 RepID=A0A090YB97_9BACI|nr:hypothetical protein DJ93_5816 [Bacillus clarus]